MLNTQKLKILTAVLGLRSEAKSAINGVLGDKLHRKNSPLAITMSFFNHSSADACEVDLQKNLTSQFDQISSSITIFVHSLMSSERIWSMPRSMDHFHYGESYGQRLQRDSETTAVYVRYNTGLHISTNGQQLAALIDELVEAWPVEVTEVNLIGHSMGGLVTRSAVHYADLKGAKSRPLIKRAYLIGAPLRGAPLEQFANILTSALATIPVPITRVIAHLLNQRSDGIKDLRHGYLVDEDWQDLNPDKISFGRKNLLPPVSGVQYFTIAGNLFNDEHHPAAKILGDILVTPYSAKDELLDGTVTDRAANDSKVFGGINHLFLVNDDDVYKQILTWWQAPHDSSKKSI